MTAYGYLLLNVVDAKAIFIYFYEDECRGDRFTKRKRIATVKPMAVSCVPFSGESSYSTKRI